MEQAVYFSDINKLKLYNRDYDRVYFGNEFCDELIPVQSDVKTALSIAKEKKAQFSLVTCYVSEHKIKNYYPLLDLVAKTIPGSEVIINDWGLLNICIKNALTPVLGRLLVRQKRDPRILNFLDKLPPLAALRLRQAALNNFTIDFLKEQKINRIELDNLFQGIELDDLRDPNISYSIYTPYGYVTTSRICFFRKQNSSEEERFMIKPCTLECRRSSILRLHNEQTAQVLFMKGNAVFFKNTSESFLGVDSRINRVVYQPEIPD